MPKYRKKPKIIDAFQMTLERRWDNSEWPQWMHEAWNRGAGENGIWIDSDAPIAEGHKSAAELVCGTLEGVHRITWGDYIIRGIKGEIYPCKPDIFVESYESVLADAVYESLDEIKELVDVLAALGVFPDGYCWCSRDSNPDPHKPEEDHQGECREARAMMRRYEPEKFAHKPEYKTGEIADATYAKLGLPKIGDPVPDTMPTTQHLINKPHGEVGFEVVGKKIVERWDVPESVSAGQALSDVARCFRPAKAIELCRILNDGKRLAPQVQRLADFIATCVSKDMVSQRGAACDEAVRIITRRALDFQNLIADMKKHSEDKNESDRDFRLNMHSIVKDIEFGEVG